VPSTPVTDIWSLLQSIVAVAVAGVEASAANEVDANKVPTEPAINKKNRFLVRSFILPPMEEKPHNQDFSEIAEIGR
jgi:hypothetical protein